MKRRRDTRTELPGDGDAIRPGAFTKRICCDCGLAHVEQMVYDPAKDLIFQSTYLSAGETATRRREMSLEDWLKLRMVCDEHILRLRARESRREPAR